MGINTELTEAGQQYAVAHAAHYGTKDLLSALGLYKGVITAHQGTQEAGYSRSQIQNIVRSVVPEEKLLEAQVNLVSAHCEHDEKPD